MATTKSKKKMVQVEIDFPYYKGGDDWAHYLKKNDRDAKKALLMWADSLEQGAANFRKIVDMVGDHPAEGQGGAHFAGLEVPATVAAALKTAYLTREWKEVPIK